jgi:shikimate kinase
MKIFLIGFMGSGKSTIGRHLAEVLGYEFVDTDHFIEIQHDTTVSQIFEQHGESVFRKMEHDALQKLHQHEFSVISTGGGMPCHDNNMDIMLAGGKVVYLKTSPQTLASRILHSRTERPLVKGKTEKELQQYIIEKLTEREPFYNLAHVIVQTENFSMEELLQSLGLMKCYCS